MLLPVRVGHSSGGLGKVVVLQVRAQHFRVGRPIREEGKPAIDRGFGFCRRGPWSSVLEMWELLWLEQRKTAPPEELSR